MLLPEMRPGLQKKPDRLRSRSLGRSGFCISTPVPPFRGGPVRPSRPRRDRGAAQRHRRHLPASRQQAAADEDRHVDQQADRADVEIMRRHFQHKERDREHIPTMMPAAIASGLARRKNMIASMPGKNCVMPKKAVFRIVVSKPGATSVNTIDSTR